MIIQEFYLKGFALRFHFHFLHPAPLQLASKLEICQRSVEFIESLLMLPLAIHYCCAKREREMQFASEKVRKRDEKKHARIVTILNWAVLFEKCVRVWKKMFHHVPLSSPFSFAAKKMNINYIFPLHFHCKVFCTEVLPRPEKNVFIIIFSRWQ